MSVYTHTNRHMLACACMHPITDLQGQSGRNLRNALAADALQVFGLANDLRQLGREINNDLICQQGKAHIKTVSDN